MTTTNLIFFIMKATLTNKITGQVVTVRSTTAHPDSSYNIPVWVDDNNQAYCQVGKETAFYEVEIETPTIRTKIGEQIKEARNEYGLTVRELGEKSGVNYSNIVSIENGRYNAKIDTIQKLCDVLGCDLKIVRR